MRTVEQYWLDFEQYGFIKERISGGYRYSLPPHLGKGGFELWGNVETCFLCYSDVLLYKPCIMLECVHEKMMEFGQFYTGEVNYYRKRAEIFPIDNGLNYWVNHSFLHVYKRMEPNKRLINVGICYREKFFETLPYEVPEDFWETAAAVLNPKVITFPALTLICDQIKNCKLEGTQLEIFAQGKCLEAFALTLNYIYSNRTDSLIYLSIKDREDIYQIQNILKDNFIKPPKIAELASSFSINQQKLMAAFKQLNGFTIYQYIKRIRMEKAAELLSESDMPINEIAKTVGYHGDGHFQEIFKNTYGTTPGKMRKEIQLSKETMEKMRI